MIDDNDSNNLDQESQDRLDAWQDRNKEDTNSVDWQESPLSPSDLVSTSRDYIASQFLDLPKMDSPSIQPAISAISNQLLESLQLPESGTTGDFLSALPRVSDLESSIDSTLGAIFKPELNVSGQAFDPAWQPSSIELSDPKALRQAEFQASYSPTATFAQSEYKPVSKEARERYVYKQLLDSGISPEQAASTLGRDSIALGDDDLIYKLSAKDQKTIKDTQTTEAALRLMSNQGNLAELGSYLDTQKTASPILNPDISKAVSQIASQSRLVESQVDLGRVTGASSMAAPTGISSSIFTDADLPTALGRDRSKSYADMLKQDVASITDLGFDAPLSSSQKEAKAREASAIAGMKAALSEQANLSLGADKLMTKGNMGAVVTPFKDIDDTDSIATFAYSQSGSLSDREMQSARDKAQFQMLVSGVDTSQLVIGNADTQQFESLARDEEWVKSNAGLLGSLSDIKEASMTQGSEGFGTGQQQAYSKAYAEARPSDFTAGKSKDEVDLLNTQLRQSVAESQDSQRLEQSRDRILSRGAALSDRLGRAGSFGDVGKALIGGGTSVAQAVSEQFTLGIEQDKKEFLKSGGLEKDFEADGFKDVVAKFGRHAGTLGMAAETLLAAGEGLYNFAKGTNELTAKGSRTGTTAAEFQEAREDSKALFGLDDDQAVAFADRMYGIQNDMSTGGFEGAIDILQSSRGLITMEDMRTLSPQETAVNFMERARGRGLGNKEIASLARRSGIELGNALYLEPDLASAIATEDSYDPRPADLSTADRAEVEAERLAADERAKTKTAMRNITAEDYNLNDWARGGMITNLGKRDERSDLDKALNPYAFTSQDPLVETMQEKSARYKRENPNDFNAPVINLGAIGESISGFSSSALGLGKAVLGAINPLAGKAFDATSNWFSKDGNYNDIDTDSMVKDLSGSNVSSLSSSVRPEPVSKKDMQEALAVTLNGNVSVTVDNKTTTAEISTELNGRKLPSQTSQSYKI